MYIFFTQPDYFVKMTLNWYVYFDFRCQLEVSFLFELFSSRLKVEFILSLNPWKMRVRIKGRVSELTSPAAPLADLG